MGARLGKKREGGGEMEVREVEGERERMKFKEGERWKCENCGFCIL